MSNTVGSSLGGGSFVSGAKTSFDVRDESDVISLLRYVHIYNLDPEIKNHLRDLIFAYRQTLVPEDAEKILQSFKALGIEIRYKDAAPGEPSASAERIHTLGSTRPAPHFGVPEASALPKVADEGVTAPSEPVIAETPKPEPVAVAPSITPPPAPGVPPVPPVQTPSVSTAGAQERIKEIKRIINEKVGNPVNLIETQGEIGREYMNALLDAMKKSNGAQQGELGAAMVRLEKAFVAVEAVTKSNIEPAAVEAAPAVAQGQASTPEPLSEEPIPVSEPEPRAESSLPLARLTVSSESMPLSTPKISSVRENLAAIEAIKVLEETTAPLAEEVSPLSVPAEAMPIEEEPRVFAPVSEGLHSVAKEKQLQDLLRASKHKDAVNAKETEDVRIAAMDPLMTPEVNAGLAQLLSEWSLFKSSGIFGTGPNGDDHPLYKKISGLTMAAVIAGRFDGATPTIKQSITDYMNGWRYEEGIVHEHTETFEHYLRKVVRQILNKKAQK